MISWDMRLKESLIDFQKDFVTCQQYVLRWALPSKFHLKENQMGHLMDCLSALHEEYRKLCL